MSTTAQWKDCLQQAKFKVTADTLNQNPWGQIHSHSPHNFIFFCTPSCQNQNLLQTEMTLLPFYLSPTHLEFHGIWLRPKAKIFTRQSIHFPVCKKCVSILLKSPCFFQCTGQGILRECLSVHAPSNTSLLLAPFLLKYFLPLKVPWLICPTPCPENLSLNAYVGGNPSNSYLANPALWSQDTQLTQTCGLMHPTSWRIDVVIGVQWVAWRLTPSWNMGHSLGWALCPFLFYFYFYFIYSKLLVCWRTPCQTLYLHSLFSSTCRFFSTSTWLIGSAWSVGAL